MSVQANIAARQAFGEPVNTGNLDAFDEVVAPGCVDHDPAPGQRPEGHREFFGQLRTAFPDLHVEVKHLSATDDDVAFAYTLTGTHRGCLRGRGATGRQIEVRGMQISRFENGKMVERWDFSDELGMLTRLGLA